MLASSYADLKLANGRTQPQPSAAEVANAVDPTPATSDKILLPPPHLAKAPTAEPSVNPVVPTALATNTAVGSLAPTEHRGKKRVIWKGKTCIIALPEDVNRGAPGAALRPLSPSAVESRIKALGRTDSDTLEMGLVHGPQSRDEYPDAEQLAVERTTLGCRIRIPNLKLWESYVNLLTEQKLRALGVGVGGDEPTATVASQNRLPYNNPPFSLPTLQPLSSGQHKSVSMAHPLVASPGLLSGDASMTSSFPWIGNPRAMIHMHRQSLAGASLVTSQHVPSPPPVTIWSSKGYVNEVSPSRGTSPALPSNMQKAVSWLASSSSHIMQNPQRLTSAKQDDTPARVKHRHEHPQNQLLEQQNESLSPHSHPPLEQVAENGEIEQGISKRPGSTNNQFEYAHPKPHAQPYNISSNLEKGLESQIDEYTKSGCRQASKDSGGKTSGIDREAIMNTMDPVGAIPQNEQAFGNNPSQQPHPVNGMTAACVTSSARDTMRSLNQTRTPDHMPKVSLSKFNIEAKEFSFNAKSAHSMNFVFAGNGTVSGLPGGATGIAANNIHESNIEVKAPDSKFSVTDDGSTSWSALNISANGSGYNVSAPFVSHVKHHADNQGHGVASLDAGNRIFAAVNMSEILKPARKSKAIPIVKPIEGQQDKEDELGRVTQGDWRSKRIRHASANNFNDDVPKFLVPSDPLGELGQSRFLRAAAGPHAGDYRDAAPDGKENDDSNAAVSKEAGHRGVGKDQGSSFALLDKEAGAGAGANNNDVAADQVAPLPPKPQVEPVAPVHANKSSLSATAKPFDLNALTTNNNLDEPDNSTPAPRVRRSQLAVSEKPRRLVASQPTSTSPATAFWPSDDPPPETTPGCDLDTQLPYPDSDDIDCGSLVQPSYNEIDAVMTHLNDNAEDLGIERTDAPWTQPSRMRTSRLRIDRGVVPTQEQVVARNHTPSPGLHCNNAKPVISHTADDGNDPIVGAKHTLPYGAEIHCLNSPGDLPVSDWDDVLSGSEEDKLRPRSQFLGLRVNDMVDAILQHRLEPLEKGLQLIQGSIETLAPRHASGTNRRSFSAEIADSDADDEDDAVVAFPNQPWSPRKGRKNRVNKVSTDEVVSMYQGTLMTDFRASILSGVREAIADLRVPPAPSELGKVDSADMRAMVEEALNAHFLALIEARQEDSLQRQATGERTLALEHERSLRTSAEEREAESQRLARLAEEELRTLRESHGDKVQKFHELSHEMQEAEKRIIKMETEGVELREKASALAEETAALQSTLDEYRISSSKWRKDIDEANEDREALRKSVSAWRKRAEESHRIRDISRAKLEKIQGDMALAASQIADEKASWAARDMEQFKAHQLLTAKLESEIGRRERMELDVQRLEVQIREANKVNSNLEQAQADKMSLEEIVRRLRQDKTELQNTATYLQREIKEAKQSAYAELQHARTLATAEVDAANAQASLVRAELESQLAKTHAQLEAAMTEADMVKSKYQILLDGSTNLRESAIRAAEDAKSLALQEQRERYELHLAELKAHHGRALGLALEDKQRSETYLSEKLGLSDAKLEHLENKILHLEEKLEIAKAAAQAAVATVDDFKAPATSNFQSPETGSPEALRESILVLQEQLHEREMRIESLEFQLSEADTEAPNKVKERDTEIGWLRELLGLRIDDLSDVINTLSQPEYDRDSVRNAAIRIRANLQMEQQEKQRLIGEGQQTFPALANLSSFASPKAAQLAAAFGTWRKGRDALLSNVAYATAADSEATPSKSASPARTFLSGLMTPPRSNLRRTSQPGVVSLQPKKTVVASPEPSATLPPRPVDVQPAVQPAVIPGPATPPLMRRTSYDQDAEEHDYGSNVLSDGEQSNVNANHTGSTALGPFSPTVSE